jgi:hypothetical protein
LAGDHAVHRRAYGESEQTRDRVRQFARARLAAPADDAFLAEIVAAESDY